MMRQTTEWDLVTQPIAAQLRKAGWAVSVEHRLFNRGVCDLVAGRMGERLVVEAKVKAGLTTIDQLLGYCRELTSHRPIIATLEDTPPWFRRICADLKIDVWRTTVPVDFRERLTEPPLAFDTMRSLYAWLSASCDDATVTEASYSFPELKLWQVREAFSWLGAWGYGEWHWDEFSIQGWKRERFLPLSPIGGGSLDFEMEVKEMHDRLDHRPLRDTVTHHDLSRRPQRHGRSMARA